MTDTTGPRLALFDADGVLLDSLAPHLQICADKSRELGLGLTIPTPAALKEMVRRNVRISPMRYFFTAVGFPEDAARRADADYQATFARDYPSPVYTGVDAALSALRRAGFALGIVTANVHSNVMAALGPCAAYFREDCIFAKDTGPASKSDAIAAALSRCGITHERTIYVGDQPADLDAAQAAGVRFVAAAYGWGFAPHGNPFPTVCDVSELPGRLASLIP